MVIKIAKVLISITKIPAKISAISSSSAGLQRTQARRQRKLKEWQYQSVSLQLKLNKLSDGSWHVLAVAAWPCENPTIINVRWSIPKKSWTLCKTNLANIRRTYSYSKKPVQSWRECLSFALRTAHDAYAAFIFERCSPSSPSFHSISDLFDSGYEGLMMGDKLELVLP
jgi:hypothetical protein